MASSTVSGWMVSRSGRVKSYVVTGLVPSALGFLVLSTVDEHTSRLVVSLGMLGVGIGVGMPMQNLVLVVQNSVPLRELGAASGAITIFRSLGGTIGVSVLGAILASRVSTNISDAVAASGRRHPLGRGDGSTLDLAGMPAFLREIVESPYGSSTGDIFLVATGIALAGLVVVCFLPKVQLRDTVDLAEPEGPDQPASEREALRTRGSGLRAEGGTQQNSGAVPQGSPRSPHP